MTDREYLIARCLRLEERVHALECQLRRAGREPRRLVTAAEAALMCDLRARGVKMVTISARTGWAVHTVERHTRGLRVGDESTTVLFHIERPGVLVTKDAD